MLLKQGQEGQRPDYLQAVGPQALCLASTWVLTQFYFLFGPSDLIMYLHVPVLKKINTLN